MIYALIEQTKPNPSIWIQIVAIVVFIIVMIRLMNKTPSNRKDSVNENNQENE